MGVGDFNIPLSTVYPYRKLIGKHWTLDKLGVTSIHRTSHPTKQNTQFFPNTVEHFLELTIYWAMKQFSTNLRLPFFQAFF